MSAPKRLSDKELESMLYEGDLEGWREICAEIWRARQSESELLEALSQIVDAYDKGIGVTLPKTSLALARTAIAKAEGKE